jgi:acyl carrier protein
MRRDKLELYLREILLRCFEIEDAGFDDDLVECFGFDSIDAIELLQEIEGFIGIDLTREEEKQLVGVRTLRQVIDCIESILNKRKAVK